MSTGQNIPFLESYVMGTIAFFSFSAISHTNI